MLRDEYLREVDRTEFSNCGLQVINVQALNSFAVVKCRIGCECSVNGAGWTAEFLVIDVWINKGQHWKALNRHASIANSDDKTPGV
jgi:hypothetical protein